MEIMQDYATWIQIRQPHVHVKPEEVSADLAHDVQTIYNTSNYELIGNCSQGKTKK